VAPEFNYLINPRHTDMGLVRILSIMPFEYDQRLFESREGSPE
jgi:hypothetical protein